MIILSVHLILCLDNTPPPKQAMRMETHLVGDDRALGSVSAWG